MFACEFDPAFGFAVMLFELPADDADYARYLELLPKLDERAAGRDSPVLVMAFAEAYPMPSAIWRKRMVEARDRIKSSPLVAIVAPSVALRAAVALANWIKTPQYEQRVFSTFEQAMEWIGEKRGPTTKVLYKLHEEAKASLHRAPPARP